MNDDIAAVAIGYCRFCGKSRMVDEPCNDPDIYVTIRCDCKQAQRARKMVETRQYVSALCEESGRMKAIPAPVIEAIVTLAQSALDGPIDAITISLTDGSKLKIRHARTGLEAAREMTIAAEPMEHGGLEDGSYRDYMKEIEAAIRNAERGAYAP